MSLEFTTQFSKVETEHGQVIHQAVLDGLWPFVPQVVDLEMFFDIDFNIHWLYVDAWHRTTRWPNGTVTGYWRFFHKEKIDTDVLVFDPFRETHRLAVLVRNGMRHRDTIPNHHDHHLGEE